MTGPDPKPPSRKIWKYFLLALILGAAVFSLLGWYMTTKSFQDMVRARLVHELEAITGGRVEVGSVHTVPFRFQVEVRNLTIHGLERDTEIPYAHVDHLVIHLKITSALSLGLAFRSVVVEHPTIHFITYADGSTNQPRPHPASSSGSTSLQHLFALSINNLDVRSGEAIWNDQRFPFDFTANHVFAEMNYSLLHNRYEASLLLGKAMTRYKNFTPIAWTADSHFRIGQDSIEVRSLEITSGRSHVKAYGTIANFASPVLSGTYYVVLDLAEARTVAGITGIRSGILEASGKGTWAKALLSSAGKLLGRNITCQTESVVVRSADFSTRFLMDSKRISFPDIAVKILGGTVSGSAEITDWQTENSARSSKSTRPFAQAAEVQLKLKDISAGEIAAALSTPKRPFSKMAVAGVLTGSVEAKWKGSPKNLVAEMFLEVAEPTNLNPRQLGVKGQARATYRRASDELEVAEFTASTKATQVRASGTLSNSATVKLSVSTSNLGEWQPILIAAGYTQPVPVKLLGPASFNGTATGRLASITFAGKLVSGNFDFVVPATSRTPETYVHWDSFATDIRISPAGLALRNSTLRRNTTVVAFDLNLGLEDRHFTPTSPFTARINMQHGNLKELLEMAGYDVPATGNLDLSAQLAGTRTDPEGTANVHISNAVIRGQSIQQLSSTLSFNKGVVHFGNFSLAQSQSSITGDASYTFLSRAFTLNLSGSHFDLARFQSMQSGGVSVQGQANFVVRGSGTIENPVMDAKIKVRDLTLDEELAGDFTVNAITNGNKLHVNGVSQFKNADLKLEGEVQPSLDWPATLDLHFAHLDVDSILRRYLDGHVTGHSAVAGDLHINGPLRRPSELNIAGNLSDMFADIDAVKLRNDGPVRFAVSDHLLKVEHFHLVGDNTDFSGGGSVRLIGQHEIDFRAEGRLNLKLLQSYNSDLSSTGAVNVNMTIAGTVANPLAQGRLLITNGSLTYTDSPSALSGINGSLTFTQNRFEVENLTARVGGGEVKLLGHASVNKGLISFDLGLHGEGVRLRYPPGVSSTANLDLQFTGNSIASTLAGDVVITKLAVTPGFDFGAYLQRTAQSAAISQTNPTLNRIRLDVHIVTLPELQMQTAVIRLSGDADLHLRGTAAKSVLLGRADVLEGQASFNGTKYRLERGEVTFTNPVTTVPTVDLQASTRVRDYDITLNLNGPADKLNLTYRSEPPLPTMDIIALLAFGQTTQQSTQLQQNGASSFNQDASNAILAAALNATVSNRAQRLFGVSRIKIDPQGLNTETSPTQSGPAITIEQQVASNITISYSTNVAQTSQQVIQAEYNIARNISIVAIRDQNGVVSFDVRIRQRKR